MPSSPFAGLRVNKNRFSGRQRNAVIAKSGRKREPGSRTPKTAGFADRLIVYQRLSSSTIAMRRVARETW